MLAFLFSSGGFGTCAMGLQAVPLRSLNGKTVVKSIVVPSKLVNIVVK